MMAIVMQTNTMSCRRTMSTLHGAPLRAALLLSVHKQHHRSLQKMWDEGLKIELTPNPG